MLRVYSVLYLQNLWSPPSCTPTTPTEPVQPAPVPLAKDSATAEPLQGVAELPDTASSDSATPAPYQLDPEVVIQSKQDRRPPPLKTTIESVEEGEDDGNADDQNALSQAAIAEEPRTTRKERSFSIVSSLVGSMPPTPTSLRSPLKKGEAVFRRGSIRLTEKKNVLATKLKRAFAKQQTV